MTMADQIGRTETLEEFRRRAAAAPEVSGAVARKAATLKDVFDVVEGAVPAIKDAIAAAAAPLLARIDRLESRMVEIESKGVEYVGTWSRAAEYRRGMMVTENGCVWAAVRGVTAGEQPGKSHDAWILAVKSGRDARDQGR